MTITTESSSSMFVRPCDLWPKFGGVTVLASRLGFSRNTAFSLFNSRYLLLYVHGRSQVQHWSQTLWTWTKVTGHKGLWTLLSGCDLALNSILNHFYINKNSFVSFSFPFKYPHKNESRDKYTLKIYYNSMLITSPASSMLNSTNNKWPQARAFPMNLWTPSSLKFTLRVVRVTPVQYNAGW